MKRLIYSAVLVLAAVSVAGPSYAKSDFPFQVNRDSKGKLISVEMSNSMSLSAASQEEDELAELREAISARVQAPNMFGSLAAEVEEEAPLQDDERQTYEDAKAYLGQKLTSDAASDKRLDGEFGKAKSKVGKVKAWRLLAAPTQPNAFDTEKVLEEVLKNVFDVAQQVLPLSNPVFDVFEFLVDTHVENLRMRREFFQNQLLVELEQDTKLFSKAEKSALRSSIFYSRLTVVKASAREKAKKAWNTYGDAELKTMLGKCSGYTNGKSAFGPCFKLEGQEVRNRLVSKNRLSKSASLAFDYSQPKRVRAKRQFLMVTKLGLKLLPVPGLLKKPVSSWLNSQFVNQRKTEGFMLGWANANNETRVGDWVVYGTNNPLMSK